MAARNGAGASGGPGPAANADRPSPSLPSAIEERLPELARQAERAFNENVERIRTQSREAANAANEQLEHARTYVVERVQERPFTTTLAVLGAGFLIGLLFAGGRRR
jgi:ElaB/YqjD/DUF883 family membrane-anchored ribosome-binding protein